MESDRCRRTPRELIPGLAKSILETIPGEGSGISGMREMLAGYEVLDTHRDEPYALLACALALQAVSEGNAGIGCVIADAEGASVAYGHNRVFHPRFRSDLHGEMDTMNAFEDGGEEIPPRDLTLYSSLEPCPMCMVRLVTAGMGRVLYMARDEQWGMTEGRDRLPPVWQDLAAGTVFGRLECSPGLMDASIRIFNSNIDELYEILKNR